MLIEQEITAAYSGLFENALGLIPYKPSSDNTYYKLNGSNSSAGTGFVIEDKRSDSKYAYLSSKKNNEQISIYRDNSVHYTYPFVYQISENGAVKYFKQQSGSTATPGFTCILAQDANGEWVIFNADKMYSDHGTTGIYSNFFDGSKAEIISDDNVFMAVRAARLDTGVQFKELFFVLSAKNYSDNNCLVAFGGKPYRLVSASGSSNNANRFPSFAFPVSE